MTFTDHIRAALDAASNAAFDKRWFDERNTTKTDYEKWKLENYPYWKQTFEENTYAAIVAFLDRLPLSVEDSDRGQSRIMVPRAILAALEEIENDRTPR